MMQFHSKFSFLLLLCLMHICIEAKEQNMMSPS